MKEGIEVLPLVPWSVRRPQTNILSRTARLTSFKSDQFYLVLQALHRAFPHFAEKNEQGIPMQQVSI